MLQKRTYKYRFYPTPAQAQTHGEHLWLCAPRLRLGLANADGCLLSTQGASVLRAACGSVDRLETSTRGRLAARSLQCSGASLDSGSRTSAFRNFFDGRARYPTFKKKRGPQAATYASSAFTWDSTHLTLAKMDTPLDIHWSRPLPKDARPITVTITKDPAGRYFVSFLVEEDLTPLPVSPKTVEIDLGLHDVVTRSTGDKTGNERSFTKDEHRLARAQRRHAKKQKGGKNREKARRNVARLHARIADRRRDLPLRS